MVSWMLLVIAIPLMTLISSTIQETNYRNEDTKSVDDINRPHDLSDEPKADRSASVELPEKASDFSEKNHIA